MDKYVINGGVPLNGEVAVSGSKNAALPILAATLLAEGKCVIENVPSVRDCSIMLELLYKLGAEVKTIDRVTVEVDTTNIHTVTAPSGLCRKMRASMYLLGALLGRSGRAEIEMPGGCNFGIRPIDLHIKGFEALGATVEVAHGRIKASCHGLTGESIFMDKNSVGATINIMLAAVKAEGQTVIENAAREPHIVDLANFLNSMGADIKGAGTDVIKIKGVRTLYGGSYSIIPDQIEAGTFMLAAAITRGDVTVRNVIPKHLESITAKLVESGVEVTEFDEAVRVVGKSRMKGLKITAVPYPGFPTDMQPQMTTLLCFAEGTSIVTETVWDNRFRYVDELKRMGADIQVEGRVAVVIGHPLTSATVAACDLRAGAALILAGLAAEGVTTVECIEHIERGYEDIVGKFRSIGARLEKISSDEPEIHE